MKQILSFILLMLTLVLCVQSQVIYTLPSNYAVVVNYDGKEQRIDGDFDNDGISDLAVLCAKGEEKKIVIYLSTRYYVNKVYYQFNWESDMVYFSYDKEVLKLDALTGTRSGEAFKFKYYSKLNNMRLIGYDEFYLGSYPQVSGYEKTVNLLTNQYEVNGTWRKTSFDVITLSNVEKYFDYLQKLGEDLKY